MSERRENREGLLLPILMPVGLLVVIGLVLFGFSRILLGVSPNAATMVALITAAGVLGIASFVAGRKHLTGAAMVPMVGTIAGLALLAGGVALVAVGPEEEAPEAITATITAPSGASVDGFKPTTLAFKANIPTDLEFDNQDPQVQHNVVIFDGPDDTGAVLFTGEKISGPLKTTYQVPGFPAGSYFFHCEVHPDTMTGTVDVTEAGGGGGLSISAANLQFSTDTLTFPPAQENALAFNNEDAGTQHNFAIYQDKAYTDELFKGELITGPATFDYTIPPLDPGTYYFKCDVHPDMKGTLTVPKTGGAGGDKGGGAPPSGSPSPSP